MPPYAVRLSLYSCIVFYFVTLRVSSWARLQQRQQRQFYARMYVFSTHNRVSGGLPLVCLVHSGELGCGYSPQWGRGMRGGGRQMMYGYYRFTFRTLHTTPALPRGTTRRRRGARQMVTVGRMTWAGVTRGQ